MAFLEAAGVTKRFGDFTALSSLTLSVDKGSVYGLVGPNGAGKTTFIKCLMGIYRTDEGNITLDGKPIYENEEQKRRIVYVCDELFFHTTYNILQTAKLYAGLYPTFNWEIFEKLKGIFQIDVRRKVRRLSKGMQKQVAFWIAVSCQPDVMILDEPIDGLDPVMRRNTWKLLLQEVAEREMTVLISSHNLRELEDVCDHVGILHNGKVVIEKALDDVKGNIHKIQTAFPPEVGTTYREALEVLSDTGVGAVRSLIVRGDADAIREQLAPYHPLLLDILPLTLEEVFIYELGGMGYDFPDILL